jgi:hypothetical protein
MTVVGGGFCVSTGPLSRHPIERDRASGLNPRRTGARGFARLHAATSSSSTPLEVLDGQTESLPHAGFEALGAGPIAKPLEHER